MSSMLSFVTPLVDVTEITSSDFDSVVLVTDSLLKLKGPLSVLKEPLETLNQVDNTVGRGVSFAFVDCLPGRRLVYAATGPLNRDQDDVRRFSDAAEKGIKRALEAGSSSPLLVRAPDDSFEKADLVTVLGALQALYVPLECRERLGCGRNKVKKLGVWGVDAEEIKKLVGLAVALESGRIVCRDIGGSDPERMAAPRVADYLESVFKDDIVKVEVISDQQRIDDEYPLLGAVNRAARGVARHQARVIALKYEGIGDIDTTLMLVGKGVTYDTGGADIKAGGVMAGMHRDKCGAAAVAGFFQVLSALRPKGLRVVGALAMVRNSIGSDCYVSDELLVSRSGVNVRVGNTDAEGRMAMVDLLCQMREMAVTEKNPHLMTVATLTGHAVLSVGDNYTAIIDNGPARKNKFSSKLQESGDSYADPLEISTLRREDYDFIAGKSEYEDCLQCNNQPSSQTPRGHQFPAAFLVTVSGLDKHGLDSDEPLKYSHLDVAGSSGPFPGIPTGAPILALCGHFVIPRL